MTTLNLNFLPLRLPTAGRALNLRQPGSVPVAIAPNMPKHRHRKWRASKC